MNVTLPASFAFLIFCSVFAQPKPNLDDPLILKEILSVAVTSLEEREVPNGSFLSYEPQQDRPFTGWRKQCHQNGQVRFLEQFKDGKAHGLYTYWRENGKKAEQKYNHLGRVHGLWTNWYGNGQKQLQQTVRFGKIEGPASRWYKNGAKKDDSVYADGKIISVVVWKPNGDKCSFTNLEGGNGIWVRYKEDGSEDWRSMYRDGLYVLE